MVDGGLVWMNFDMVFRMDVCAFLQVCVCLCGASTDGENACDMDCKWCMEVYGEKCREQCGEEWVLAGVNYEFWVGILGCFVCFSAEWRSYGTDFKTGTTNSSGKKKIADGKAEKRKNGSGGWLVAKYKKNKSEENERRKKETNKSKDGWSPVHKRENMITKEKII